MQIFTTGCPAKINIIVSKNTTPVSWFNVFVTAVSSRRPRYFWRILFYDSVIGVGDSIPHIVDDSFWCSVLFKPMSYKYCIPYWFCFHFYFRVNQLWRVSKRNLWTDYQLVQCQVLVWVWRMVIERQQAPYHPQDLLLQPLVLYTNQLLLTNPNHRHHPHNIKDFYIPIAGPSLQPSIIRTSFKFM